MSLEEMMSTEEKMTIDERRKYLRLMQPRYAKAGRSKRGQLLDEMEEVTGLDRKTLIRLMKGSLERKRRSRERGAKYGPEVDDALRVIDESFDGICAERLRPNLVWMARHLSRHGELVAGPALLEQLGQVSVSTVARRLAQVRQDQPRLPRNPWLQKIPMLRLPWDLAEPGHFEVDLVHHSGPSTSGEYVCTLQMIDVLTGWSERWAVLGRSYLVMEDGFRGILQRLPFPVLQLHPDNGSEFFNQHMLRFWCELVKDVALSRSRPFHKNDNPRVEQKNATLVRAFLGDERLDSVAQALALNALYEKLWIYYNLFQPVMHLAEKEVVRREGQPARVIRRYDDAATPFDRLCQTQCLLPPHQEQLMALRDRINPRRLRQDIYDAIAQLFQLPGAAPDCTEDVHLTLAAHRPKREDELLFAFNRTEIKT
jgi:hypothetical protein